jgi:hypothetical protein
LTSGGRHSSWFLAFECALAALAKMNMSSSYKLAKLSGKDFEVQPVPASLINSVRSKFTNNYFGLPPYSVAQSAESLAYKSRAPLDNEVYDDADEHTKDVLSAASNDKTDTNTKKNFQSSIDLPADGNYTAQRKVARALLTMVSNDVMIKHFLFKGGLDAVLKLIQESKDLEVLQICANCLCQVKLIDNRCL